MRKRSNVKRLTVLTILFAIVLISSAFGQASLPVPKEEKLLNGLRVLMWGDEKADKVTVKIRIHSGSAFDPQGKEGLMQMLSDNLFPNEATREFFTDDLGGSLEVIANYDYIQVNASSKPESFLTMLETVATAVSNPTIDKETTTALRTALVAKVAALEGDPAYVADQAVAKRLFGTFPYGRPQFGTVDSLKRIEAGDLVKAKERFFTADNATLAIYGNFDRSLALKAIKRYLGVWSKADKTIPPTFRQPDEPDTKELRIEMPGIDKIYSRSAKFAPARNGKDYYAMILLGWIRIEQRCGEKALYQANLLRGSVTNREDKEIKGASMEELPLGAGPCPLIVSPTGKSGSFNIPIDKAEFDSAKSKLVASIQKLIVTPPALADLWLDVDTYKLSSPYDDLRKLTGITFAGIQTFAKQFVNYPAVKVVVQPPAKPAAP